MYRNLWAIGAKEVNEYQDYSFQDHFGKELPSYLPREMYRRYLDGEGIHFTREQYNNGSDQYCARQNIYVHVFVEYLCHLR
jgi:hypothetical protein